MNIEQAAQQLYEDESLTDELDDDAAQALLKWAETMLPKLAETHSSNEAFDKAVVLLRGYTKRVNHLAGLGASIDLEQQKMLISQMMESATQMGFQINTAQYTQFAQQMTIQSPMSMVQMMTSWLSPEGDAPAPTMEAQAESNETPFDSSELPADNVEQPEEMKFLPSEVPSENVKSHHEDEVTSDNEFPMDDDDFISDDDFF